MSGPALPAALPAITLWQPWATWIALRWKTIETRPHPHLARLAGFRVALHAGKRLHREAFSIAKAYHGAPSTPSELLQLAREQEFFAEVMAKPSEAGRTVTFGRMLKKHRDRPVGRFIIRHACGTSKRATYRLEAVADDTRS